MDNGTSKLAFYGALMVVVLSVVAVGIRIYIYNTQPLPGNGPQAERGFETANKIIDGLERYKTDRTAYPRTLGELVPQYYERNPQQDVQAGIKFTYFPIKETYELKFIYETTISTVECNYYATDQKWRCGEKE